MALVTLQLSSLERDPDSIPGQDEEKSRRSRMQRRQSFVMVKGAALLLQDEGEPEETTEPPPTSGPSEQQLHLQAMLRLLREEDTLRLAVRLEPVRSCLTRYLLVVSSMGRSNEEETILLGVDFPHNGSLGCTIGTVLPVWSNTQVFLDGDGGFSVTSGKEMRMFRPISVQTMWSLLQILHKACEAAVSSNHVPAPGLRAWITHYRSHRASPQICIHAWATTSDIISTRRDPTTPERDETEVIIRRKLRDILRESDLENITSKEVRSALERHTFSDLQDYTEFIDNEMILILAQMDRPSEIFSYLYLGSEWNASNLEELQRNKVGHILNVTREIDNFFPESFTYLNIRVLDEESTDLLPHWKETHRFITAARRQGSRVLVHCKMGVSRSASTVIAYSMKEYDWTLETALRHARERRSIIQPNPGFMRQLHIYQGILAASKQRHSSLWDPTLHQLPRPPEICRGPPTSPLTPRRRKINLRALMQSISVMEREEEPAAEREEPAAEREEEEPTTEREEPAAEREEEPAAEREEEPSAEREEEPAAEREEEEPAAEREEALTTEREEPAAEREEEPPTEREEEEPAPVERKEPAPVEREEPAPVEREEPAPAEREEPAPAEREEPAPAEREEPAPAEREEPAPAEREEPAPAEREEPVATEREEPARSVYDTVEGAEIRESSKTTQESATICEETASVEEYPHGPPSSSSRRRSRRRRKSLPLRPAEPPPCRAEKSQSLCELEGTALVSKRLQGEQQGGRRVRFTRQKNVGDAPEES